MKNKFEHILLSLLSGLSVLLGLTFWLNITFNFNIFSGNHWAELSKLQAMHIPISSGFYVSIAIAIFIFLSGLFVIYGDEIKNIRTHKHTNQTTINEIKKTDYVSTTIEQSRPPRLNLPKNISEIAAQKNAQQQNQNFSKPQQDDSPSMNPYNPILSDIFMSNGYVVKKNPVITGFTPNLFAIADDETLWIGGVDTNVETMIRAITKLQSVFQETLEDIPININAFIIDTLNQIGQNDSVMIFKSIDNLRAYINQNPAPEITDEKLENFDAYSNYIDTIIQYIKKA